MHMSTAGTTQVQRRPKRARRPGRKFGKWQLIALALVALLAIAWTIIAMVNGTVTTVTRTLSIPGLPSALEGYTIVQLTDLNGATFGEKQEKLADAISAVDYDVICMTGDMVGASGNAQPLYDLLDALNTSKPIMFITGDSDPDPLADTPGADGTLYADYIRQLQTRGVTYVDSPQMITVGNANIWFSSVLHLNINTQSNLDSLEQMYNSALADPNNDANDLAYDAYRLDCARKLNNAAQNMQSVDLHITLSHVPLSDEFVHAMQYAEGENSADTQDEYAGNQYLRLIDLALCGHYVGGQWRLPFVGALYVPDERLARGGWLPEQDEVSGLRRSNSVYIYTSTGLGTSDAYSLPPFRLFNQPEIVVIRLTSQLGA